LLNHKDMLTKKIGYISIEFNQLSKGKIQDVAKKIPKEDFIFATSDGKLKGGDVTDKLHLTLYYGIDANAVDKKELDKLISAFDIKSLKINEISAFELKNFNCKILHLSIDDTDKQLAAAHNQFNELAHFKDVQQNFISHVTLAYVKDSFDVDEFRKTVTLPKNLEVERISYKLKS